MLTSFGSFESYYTSDLLAASSSTAIAAIGSVQSFLMVFLGFVTGPLFDMGYFRPLLVTGSLLIVGGTLLQSAGTRFWHLLLAQGVCVGLGTGCLAILSVGVPSMWFDSRLPLANGLAASGSGVGGVLFPIIFRTLASNATVGFPWAVRVMALAQLLTLAFAIFTMRLPPAPAPPPPPSPSPSLTPAAPGAHAASNSSSSSNNKDKNKKKKHQHRPHRALWDPTALHDRPYCLFVLGCFVTFLGLYVPYFYVPSYSTELLAQAADDGAQTTSQLTGDDLLSILNAASIVGRLLLGSLAIGWGPHNMIAGVACCAAIVTLCFSLVTARLAAIVCLVCAYGFLSGAFFALQPTVFARISADRPQLIGTRFGMAFTVMSFGMLSGTPIAGALKHADGFSAAWVYAGLSIYAGSAIIFASLMTRKGSVWSAR